MKILVTGGAGFIGSHVVNTFIKTGHQVTIMDDLSTGSIKNLDSEAKFIKLDIRSEEARKYIEYEKFEVIDHHAAHIHVGKSVEDPLNDAYINIIGTINIMEGARNSGTVKHVIMASSGGAIYGNEPTPCDESMSTQPLSPYGISKRAAELYLYFYQKQYGITFTALRYANVYGPRQNSSGEAGVISIFINNIKNGKESVIYGDGKQTRDFVYVGDVAKANLMALQKRISGEFNIGTNSEININDLYHMIQKETNSNIVALKGSKREGEQKTSSLDFKKAAVNLRWEPSTDFIDGIKQTIKYYQ